MKAVGLISGTSADGVSAALVELGAKSLRVLRYRTFPYTRSLRQRVLAAPEARAPELSRLNFELGEVFSRAALSICRGQRVDVIGSHGQTVWHGPAAHPPNTMQIGEPAVIAERTKTTVVADFRPRDMAAGGQGAPLIPAFDLFLFGNGPLRAVVNIGGIANVSFVGRGKLHSAFDTGPGNALMDEALRRATHGRVEADLNGALAARGRPDERLLRSLLAHPYFFQSIPKSLDRSTFGPALLSRIYPRLPRAHMPDILATLCEFTARSLWLSIIENAPGPISQVVISGGGAFNRHLMRRLRALFQPVPVVLSDSLGMPVMAKEAACFAWMAARSLRGKTHHAPAATGARGPRLLGKICPA